MWSKIYIAVLAVAMLVMAFFTYYSWSWLQSIGSPTASVEGYIFHSGMAWTVLWVSGLVLILLANAAMWASGRSWAVWTTLLYFSVFIVIRYFWLGQEFFNFTKDNNFTDRVFSFSRVSGLIVLVIATVIAYFDQFIIVRLRSKTYGDLAQVPAATIEKADESSMPNE